MRHLGLIGLLAYLCAGHAAAYNLPACDDAALSTIRQIMDFDEYVIHGGRELGPVIEAPGRLNTFGFSVSYTIDETGRLSCLTPSGFMLHPFQMTPERQAFLDNLAKQTFTPFLIDGRPEAVYLRFHIDEEEHPPYHVMRPEGEITSAVIRLERHGHHGNPFVMTARGDGNITYVPAVSEEGYADLLGPQTYRIPPEQIAQMLNLAEKADFWSLRDKYYPEDLGFRKDGHAAFYDEVTITLGNRTKTFRAYSMGGAPAATESLVIRMSDLGNREMWERVDSDTLAQLALNGYDFSSEKSARLLIALTSREDVPASLITDLMNRGTPRGTKENSFLDATITGRRVDMANLLIDQGALLKNGTLDAVILNRAFSNAVLAALPTLLTRLLPYHPDLTIRRKEWETDKDGREVQRWTIYPLITLVGERSPYADGDDTGMALADLTATTQILLDAGENINRQDSSGRSLLANTIERDDVTFSRWLISKGAIPMPSIRYTHHSANMEALLLEAGIESDNSKISDEIKDDDQSRTTIWLKGRNK